MAMLLLCYGYVLGSSFMLVAVAFLFRGVALPYMLNAARARHPLAREGKGPGASGLGLEAHFGEDGGAGWE